MTLILLLLLLGAVGCEPITNPRSSNRLDTCDDIERRLEEGAGGAFEHHRLKDDWERLRCGESDAELADKVWPEHETKE